jgi:alpha-mannosidase
LGTKRFHIRPSAPPPLETLLEGVECGNYRLGWDEHGVRSIVDLSSGQELLPAGGDPAGHLLLETDSGDPWGTRSLARPRCNLTSMTHLQAARRRGGCAELIFAGHFDNGPFGSEHDFSVYGFTWYQRVRVLEGLPWVEFDCDIFWFTANRRIRIAFPSRSATDRGLYKIPYGVLARDRYEMTDTTIQSPNGDWPGTTFATTLPDGKVPGIAVLNTGTPSVRIEDGTLLYSVLRSPGFGYCLQNGSHDHPVPTTLMNDSGPHHFTFGLLPYTGANLPQVLEAGYAINQLITPYHVPHDSADFTGDVAIDALGVYISAIKPSYAGNGITVRLVEQLGQARTVTLSVPPHAVQVYRADALEDQKAILPITASSVEEAMNAYGIATIVIR